MTNARILAVDDEPGQLAALRRILRRCDYEVLTAADGKTGLRMAIRQSPDLILLDVNMPGVSGYEFLSRLRRIEMRRHARDDASRDKNVAALTTPVIFVTGEAGSEQCKAGLEAGAVDYITKPFEPDELRARIASHIERARKQREEFATVETDLARRNSALINLRDTARACTESLQELYAYVELSSCDLSPSLRKLLLDRARRDVRNLLQTVTRIAEESVQEEATV